MHKTLIAGGLTAAVSVLVALAVPSSAQTGIDRKPLLTADLGIANHQAVQVQVTIAPGGREGRHVHAGPLLIYVLAGEEVLELKDRPTKVIKAGESFLVEPGLVHEGFNKGTTPLVVLGTFINPKDKPLSTPAP
ncbi:MAG: cupin domain-containing protein [Vicinamibacterales bacterium]